MAQLSEAERYLIEQIRRGSSDGWSQLVARYEGRLLSFARSRLKRSSDAEDLVQDTFVSFLGAVATFNDAYSIETFLFTILRRKLIDHFRGRSGRVCFLHETLQGSVRQEDDSPTPQVPADDPSASRYLRLDESRDQHRDALAGALHDLVERLKSSENFRDLKIVEMLFYAHVRNKDAAALLNMDEKQIALIKHRCLKEVRDGVLTRLGLPRDEDAAWGPGGESASLLTEIWERQRPTCPKRSTIGRLILGTLDGDWREYVHFHVHTLGCGFCRANFDDLTAETTAQPKVLHDRVMQSTVGFFKPS